jgi:class 3 adenylate cyclase
MQVEKAGLEAGAKRIISLDPIPLWKWSAVLLLLLSFPLYIFVDQMIGSFKSSRDQTISEIGLQPEKVVGRALEEKSPKIQINEILQNYIRLVELPSIDILMINRAGIAFSPIPFVSAHHFKRLLQMPNMARLKYLEKRLRQAIPGIKLMKWDGNLQIKKSSDVFLHKFVYKNLIDAIFSRLTQNNSSNSLDRSYVRKINLIQKFFTEDANLVDFVKFGDLAEFTFTSGTSRLMFWHSLSFKTGTGFCYEVNGFLAVIEDEKLPTTYGVSKFNQKKAHEWESEEISFGWVDTRSARASHLPYPFPAFAIEKWRNWVADQPNGLYEKDDLLVAIRRAGSRLVLVAAKDIKAIDRQFRRKTFLLFFFIFLALAVAIFSVFFYRKNGGVALSIKWQMLALFLLVTAMPSLAVMHLGFELLKDRQKTYENEAFKKLERLRKDIEDNVGYVFTHLEIVGDEFCRAILEFYRPDGREVFAGADLDRIIDEYSERAGVEHLYLFNAAGEEVLRDRSGSNQRKGLLPLVSSLAKLKLRLNGKLVEEGYSGAVSLMDLMLEETGGAKLSDIQAMLKTKDSSAFELKFTDRRTYFFVGQFSPPKAPDQVFIMVFIIKDRKFDELYLDLMIRKFQQEKKTGSDMQLFYGANDFDENQYFLKSDIKAPFFAYNQVCPDSIGIGKLTEPTRFAGISVKDSYRFSDGQKVLLYSFKPSGIDAHTVLALYDYSEISERLEMLRVMILVIFLVSVLIVYILVRITARSVVLPIQMLKQAVNEVEVGNYSQRVFLPGEDELVELSKAFNNMTRGLEEREKMTRYLSKSAVEAVKSDSKIALGGQKVPATILFSDIRNFTTISESNEAETVVSLLNDYFAQMNVVIEKFDGDIDKFIGDAIMAQFIAVDKDGFSPADMALKAVKCGLEMMSALESFNQQRKQQGKFPIMIGVGINSGEVIAGNIGSPGRMDHTVIGDVVNVASRLEGMSKLGKHTHVIISKDCLELIKDKVDCVKLEETAVKGKTSAVEMFEVIRCR